MVEFKYINIKNFRSIKNATLYFKPGVWRVLGTNNDTEGFDSNASGKSTALSALQQCLFNRTIFGTAIEDSYHKQGGSGYILETMFTVEDRTYKVVNDRTVMKITIYEVVDDTDIDIGIRSIPQAIAVVQDLIGMDFNTFIATTYISHSTVVEMLEHFTSSALLKIILNFDRMYAIDKSVKRMLTESSERTRIDAARVTSIKESLTILDAFKRVNVKPLRDVLDTLLVEKVQLSNGALQSVIDGLKNSINSDTLFLQDQTARHKKLTTQLNTTVCSCCNQEITVDVDYISAQLDAVNYSIASTTSILAEAKDTLDACVQQMEEELHDLYSKISHYTNSISVAEYKNELYNQHKKQADTLRSELATLESKLSLEYAKQDVYQAICDTIKSGAPLKDLIHNFCTALNIYIDEYTPLVSIDYLNVKAKAKKNNLEFVVHDSRFNTFISVNELSGGELMRVRVILLLALLKAIQTLTGVSSNILVFDEALDALDASAGNDLATLFGHLSLTHDKFIALVSHGNQLNSIDFDGFIQVSKSSGISTLTQQ